MIAAMFTPRVPPNLGNLLRLCKFAAKSEVDQLRDDIITVLFVFTAQKSRLRIVTSVVVGMVYTSLAPMRHYCGILYSPKPRAWNMPIMEIMACDRITTKNWKSRCVHKHMGLDKDG
jgi:hypothetical protein